MAVPHGFNARKAAQVVAFFAVHEDGESINIVKAMKLVYLADRHSMATHGFPILEEPRVSMKLGPVNSTTYRFMNGECVDGSWTEMLNARANHEVSPTSLSQDVDYDELSDADIACLEAVWSEFGHMDQWELADWTHQPENVPEWEDPGSSSSSIPTSRIMKSLGIKNATEQAEIVDDYRNIARLLSQLRQ